jgi:hypothetical protein
VHAGEVELVILVALVVIVGLIVSKRAADQRNVEARRLELETWELEERDDPFFTTWTVHFPTMKMVMTFEVLDHQEDEDEHAPREFVLKRSDGGGWRMKWTDACFRSELESAHDAVASGALGAASRLAELETGNKWRPMPTERFAGLEPAYQRYVRQA